MNAVPCSGGTDLPDALALYRAISTRKGDLQSTERESMQLWPHSLTDTTPATSNLDLGKKKNEERGGKE